MDELQLVPATPTVGFRIDGTEVRVVTISGNPWFVATDVSDALAYRDASNITRNLDYDKKGMAQILTPGGFQTVLVISRLGLINVLTRQRKSKALSDQVLENILSQVDDFNAVMSAFEDFEVPEDLAEVYIYAIRNTDTGNLKLGISRDPEQRLKSLQIGCDGKLVLVAYRKAENRFADERVLHKLHAEGHVRGEWFGPSASIN